MDNEVKKYVVTAKKAGFGPGSRLALTTDQAATRKHNLSFVTGNVWDVVAQVEFKRGEMIGIIGEANKSQLQEIAPEADPKAIEALAEAEAKKLEVEALKQAEAEKKQAEEEKRAAEKTAREEELKKFASEKAAAEAEKAGIAAADIKGSGKNGAITVKDVAEAVKARAESGEKPHDDEAEEPDDDAACEDMEGDEDEEIDPEPEDDSAGEDESDMPRLPGGA